MRTLLAAILVALAFAPAPAAAKICTVEAVQATGTGGITRRGAVDRAWRAWRDKMRREYGRNYLRVRAVKTGETIRRRGRRYYATIRARGCRRQTSCVTGTGITPSCTCTSYREAVRRGCREYKH